MWSCQKNAMDSWNGRSVSTMIRVHHREMSSPVGKAPEYPDGSDAFTSSGNAAVSTAVPDRKSSMSST